MKVTQEQLESITALINELKSVRRVRTPQGAQHYGQPIGTPIVRDVPFNSTALLSHPAITSLPPALGEAPLPDGFVRMYHQTNPINLPSIREEGLLWDRGRGVEGPKGVWISDKPFYQSSPNLATIEIAIPAEDREQMGRIASIGDIPPERFLTINEEWHDRVRQIVQEQRYMDALANGEYDDILEDEGLADDPSVRAIRYIRDNILNAESYDSWRDVEFNASEHDPNLNYYLEEPNPPAKLYHVAPSSARDRITTDGLDASGNTWNTGAGASDQWRDEWLWTVGEDGEEFAYEYRPTGVYMFQSLERAMQYYNDDQHDIYEIDTVENDRQIIRDPSQAMNWEYEDEYDHSYVTRYVTPSALRLIDATEDKTENESKLSVDEVNSGLIELAKQFDTFESFSRAYSLQNLRTRSWHITDSEFLIDPDRRPTSRTGTPTNEPVLFTTIDPELWSDYTAGRDIVVEFDLSNLSFGSDFYSDQSGNEGLVIRAGAFDRIREIGRFTREEAIARSEAQERLIPQSREELEQIWNLAQATTEEKADRRVRDPQYWGVPYGTPIVPGMKPSPRQLELPGMPKPIESVSAINDETRASRRETSIIGFAREEYEDIERLLRFTRIDEYSPEGREASRELYNRYGIAYEDGPWANTYASGGDWLLFGGCRDIRNAAYDILGFNVEDDEENIADPHLSSESDPGWGQAKSSAKAPYGYAYALLKDLNEAEKSPIPLWRGVELYNYSNAQRFIEDLKKEDTFDLPLASFAGRRRDAERFGDSVIFRLQVGARGIQGGFMGYDEDDDKEYAYDSLEMSEVVTGGRFKVTNVSQDRQGRFVVSIKQVATFNPDSGIATKMINRRWKYAYLFDNSLRANESSVTDAAEIIRRTRKMLQDILEGKGERRVRTPEGARRYGQPIGSVIRRDVLPAIPPLNPPKPEDSPAYRAAEKIKSVRKIPNFDFKAKDKKTLEAKDSKTGYVARITTSDKSINLQVMDGEDIVYQTRKGDSDKNRRWVARRAQYEMKKPYIIAAHEQSKRGKRKQPGFRELYKGRYAVDWSEEGPGYILEDDIDGRWAAGLAESKELGIDYVQRVGSSNEIHFESIETINSVMRVHEELLPGFTYYVPKIGVKPMPKRNALAYNVVVKGSVYSDRLTFPSGDARYLHGFVDPELNYDYTGIGLSKDYFASDWDEVRAYQTLDFNKKDWWTVDPRTLAQEAGYEDWEGLIFSVFTHEVGHTLGRVATGDLNTVQGDRYHWSLRERAMKELQEIFVEFGLLVEGENLPFMSSSISLDTQVLRELLSEYGTTNIHEMFAEVWAEYMMADRPRPFAQRVGSMLQELMADWIDHEFEGYGE